MDYSAANQGLWSFIIQLGLIAGAVLLANFLRQKLAFVRKSLMPVAVLAGFLLLITKYLGIVKLGSATTTSLGTLLADASAIWTNYPHLMILPALFISLLMISFNLFGNGLRDAFNPSLRGAEE